MSKGCVEERTYVNNMLFFHLIATSTPMNAIALTIIKLTGNSGDSLTHKLADCANLLGWIRAFYL